MKATDRRVLLTVASACEAFIFQPKARFEPESIVILRSKCPGTLKLRNLKRLLIALQCKLKMFISINFGQSQQSICRIVGYSERRNLCKK